MPARPSPKDLELGILRLWAVELRNQEFWGCGAKELEIFGDAAGV